jgi:hypothetical protein
MVWRAVILVKKAELNHRWTRMNMDREKAEGPQMMLIFAEKIQNHLRRSSAKSAGNKICVHLCPSVVAFL